MTNTNTSELLRDRDDDREVLTLGLNDLCDSDREAFTSSYVCRDKTFEILITDDLPPGYDHDSTTATEIGWEEFMTLVEEEIRKVGLPRMLELAPPPDSLTPPLPNGGIVGILLHKIPAKFPVLDNVVNGKVPVLLPLRQKWAAQIEGTLSELHGRRIIWGDAKPGNVIIGERDDAWLIDFGGGFTLG
ncbi:hypothetical protein B0H66DRAFT_599016 [Apodospora peruviana]|uniref:Protein kinase domain-containing protein n=1 Tax=Apodospora peruviana TaxID=516989 RepID=A0AAE0IV44_9PEZI|nr:hypothetical protein B0H66DRAFT_599016 [Apodospora peruviana]